MEITRPSLEGLLLIKPDVFVDDRGCFFESWSKSAFHNIGLDLEFVQDNQSFSRKDVLRGLHFQNPPYDQGKLVRVVKGKVLDVVVDIRKKSATYGKYFSVELSDSDNMMFWIPPGFAHGFLTLENDTIFTYKCTKEYNKSSEGALLWDDPTLDIQWGIQNPLVSEKDLEAASFQYFESQF